MACGSGTLLGWPPLPPSTFSLKQVLHVLHKRHPFRWLGVLTSFFQLFCLDVNHVTIAGKSSHPCWKRIKNPWGVFTSSWLSFFRQQRKREKKRGFAPLQTFSTNFRQWLPFIHFLTLPNACSLKKRVTTVHRGPNWQPLNLGGKQRFSKGWSLSLESLKEELPHPLSRAACFHSQGQHLAGSNTGLLQGAGGRKKSQSASAFV